MKNNYLNNFKEYLRVSNRNGHPKPYSKGWNRYVVTITLMGLFWLDDQKPIAFYIDSTPYGDIHWN